MSELILKIAPLLTNQLIRVPIITKRKLDGIHLGKKRVIKLRGDK